MFYDVIKSLHLVAVISWMVGLLYLPRLFVYHNEAKINSEMDSTFLKMEYETLQLYNEPSLISIIFIWALFII